MIQLRATFFSVPIFFDGGRGGTLEHLAFEISTLLFETSPILLEHFLFGTHSFLFFIVSGNGVFRGFPKCSDVFHLDVEIQEFTDEFGIPFFVFLIRVKGSELRKKNREIVLNKGIRVND